MKIQSEKKKGIGMILLIIVIVLAYIGGFIFKIYMPKKDDIDTDNLLKTCMIINEDNYADYQFGDDSVGYAGAYVMRHMGKEANGAVLFETLQRDFGVVTIKCLQKGLEENNISTKAYYGSIDTLKAELVKGNPVIAVITPKTDSENGLHYVAVVGYDEQYIYMADSDESNTNVSNVKQYNRKVTYEQFLELWKVTTVYPMDNLYIVAE